MLMSEAKDPLELLDSNAEAFDAWLNLLKPSQQRAVTTLLLYLGLRGGPYTPQEIARIERISVRTVHARLMEAERLGFPRHRHTRRNAERACKIVAAPDAANGLAFKQWFTVLSTDDRRAVSTWLDYNGVRPGEPETVEAMSAFAIAQRDHIQPRTVFYRLMRAEALGLPRHRHQESDFTDVEEVACEMSAA